MHELPIDAILPALRDVVSANPNVILTAEPGAGKTTRVPVSLLHEQWLKEKKVLMLEPRRLAAIRSAEYMAEQRNESVGGMIGYRIRGESRISKNTRLEVVTEGILTRLLQEDASLEPVGMIIFDEFHERSIHADLGLALSLDVQRHLRPDLKILVMSATLDAEAISDMMGNTPIVHCHGKQFPVEVSYSTQPTNGPIEPVTANSVVKALRAHEGDILVFLPGQREIKTVSALLQQKELPPNIEIHLLFGESSSAQQRAALLPAPSGKRKIILSTNITETSLTIDGVRIVIDSGLMRTSTFDARRGMSGLVTIPISNASAEQRKGRAGRQAPGHCYRLWTSVQHALLAPYSKPEITVTDLAPLAMELALWGDAEGKTLRFLNPPPSTHLAQSRQLLTFLGAIDPDGNLTEHGKLMGKLPIHPRYAHMLIKGKELHCGDIACDVAAMLDEREILRGQQFSDIDVYSRYIQLKEGKISDRFALVRIREQSDRLKKMMGLALQPKKNGEQHIGLLLALAYPERVAKRKASGKYQLSGNTIASLPKGSMLGTHEYLAVGEVDGAGNDVRIFLAESITEQVLRSAFSEQIKTIDHCDWDETTESIVARSVEMFGAIELSGKSFIPSPEKSISLILEVIRNQGLTVLPWTSETESIMLRSEWIRKNSLVSDWPNVSSQFLLSRLEEWLAPFLSGITRKSQISRLHITEIIRSLFSYQQLQTLDRLAPPHYSVPTGTKIPLDYSNDPPILSVRLQEMFGETETPAVGGGKVPVLLHLLSPAKRPLAVTQDLPSFWNNAYKQVRKDMRGEYPKHYWPEDPLQAEPTKKTKRAMGMGGTER